MIRGRTLYHDNEEGLSNFYSLYVYLNFNPEDPLHVGLRELQLNSLHGWGSNCLIYYFTSTDYCITIIILYYLILMLYYNIYIYILFNIIVISSYLIISHQTEIQSGSVFVQHNNRLCHGNDILWRDIVTGESSLIKTSEQHDPSHPHVQCKRHSLSYFKTFPTKQQNNAFLFNFTTFPNECVFTFNCS